MADVKISRALFYELCKYHLYDPDAANQTLIKLQLAEKLDKLVQHDKYSAALFADHTPV